MNRFTQWIAMTALIVFPWQLSGERTLSKVLTYSDMSMLLGDKHLKNRRIELVASKGDVVQGKLAGFSDGSILLQAAPPVRLCGVSLVRLSKHVTSPLRRVAGIFGGIAAGSLVGGSVGFGVGSSSYELAALPIFLASPAIGGWAGAKLVAQREDTVYLIDPVARICPQELTSQE